MINNIETDERGRLRNKTIAFRLSPEEYEELTVRYQLCGYRTKQEFILDSIMHQKVEAKANPQLLVSFKKNLMRIEEAVKGNKTLPDGGEEITTVLKRMLEILESFEK